MMCTTTVECASGQRRSRHGNFCPTTRSRRSLGGEKTHRLLHDSRVSARVHWTISTTTVGTMTMLDVPVVYTVETSDCESTLSECQEALEAALVDMAIHRCRSRLTHLHTLSQACKRIHRTKGPNSGAELEIGASHTSRLA